MERQRRIFETLAERGIKQRWLARRLPARENEVSLWKQGLPMPAHQVERAEELLGLVADALVGESLRHTEPQHAAA
jgi:hypothetical protein